jgi:hypothetical protein
MLAYSRGSNCLAGAAPLEHRVPAVVGSFCIQPGYSSMGRATASEAVCRGFDSRYPLAV